MTRRYLLLFAAVLAAALLLNAIGRARSRAPSSPAAAVCVREVSVELRAGGAVSSPPSVALGQRVVLTIVNHTGRTARVSLSGYEDRLAVSSLGPDSVWHGTLEADRPGEQLAWLIDGAPSGRFDVTGSHLIEGHR